MTNANISKVKTNNHTLYFEGYYFTDVDTYKAWVKESTKKNGTSKVAINNNVTTPVYFDLSSISEVKTKNHTFYCEGFYFTGEAAYSCWVRAHKQSGANRHKTA